MQFEGLERKNAVESESRNIRQAGVEGSLPDPAATPHKPQEPNQCDTKRPTRADGVKERRGASEKPSEGVGMHKNRGNIYRGKLEKSSRVEDDWERQSDEDRAVWHGYDGTSARLVTYWTTQWHPRHSNSALRTRRLIELVNPPRHRGKLKPPHNDEPSQRLTHKHVETNGYAHIQDGTTTIRAGHLFLAFY